jgi:hypothetical protein
MRSSVILPHARVLLLAELDVVALRPAADGAERSLHPAGDVPRRELQGGKPRELLILFPRPSLTGVEPGMPDGASGPGSYRYRVQPKLKANT